MNIKEIEEMMALMDRKGFKKLVLRRKDCEIELEKAGVEVVREIAAPAHKIEAVEKPALEKKAEGRYITSPIVGTFYAAPSPKDPSFVKVGDQVDVDAVVCIIEAMKVMNEVKSTLSGKVAEILVKNGDPVEFGTKLIRLV